MKQADQLAHDAHRAGRLRGDHWRGKRRIRLAPAAAARVLLLLLWLLSGRKWPTLATHVLIGEEVVAQRWRVRERLEHTVHEARVAQVDEAAQADDGRVAQLEGSRGVCSSDSGSGSDGCGGGQYVDKSGRGVRLPLGEAAEGKDALGGEYAPYRRLEPLVVLVVAALETVHAAVGEVHAERVLAAEACVMRATVRLMGSQHAEAAHVRTARAQVNTRRHEAIVESAVGGGGGGGALFAAAEKRSTRLRRRERRRVLAEERDEAIETQRFDRRSRSRSRSHCRVQIVVHMATCGIHCASSSGQLFKKKKKEQKKQTKRNSRQIVVPFF